MVDDPALPADPTLATAQVSFAQELLSAASLLYDRAETLADSLQSGVNTVQTAAAYAQQWGDAARAIVEGVSTSWETLPGKPETFPPATHTHAEMAQLQTAMPSKALLPLPRTPDAGHTTLLSAVLALVATGESAGCFTANGYTDQPTAEGLVLYRSMAAQGFTLAYVDTATGALSCRQASGGAWTAGWARGVLPAHLKQQTLTLAANGWQTVNGLPTQVLAVTGLTAAQRAAIAPAAGMSATQRTALRKAMLFVKSVADNAVTICADGDAPTVDLPMALHFDAV